MPWCPFSIQFKTVADEAGDMKTFCSVETVRKYFTLKWNVNECDKTSQA